MLYGSSEVRLISRRSRPPTQWGPVERLFLAPTAAEGSIRAMAPL
jgi:hypothetical protein